ncbi:MAG: c-type cytochrome [Phycisphaerae bacterium]
MRNLETLRSQPPEHGRTAGLSGRQDNGLLLPRRILGRWGLVLLSLFVSPGCGTNFDELLIQAGTAAGRTAVDLLLTDLANSLADLGNQGAPPGDTGGGTPGGGTTPPDGGMLDGLVGTAATGASLFVSNGCSGCHCDDATGGCALSAPRIIGEDPAAIDAVLRGSHPHPIKVDLLDQDIVDLAAFLGSLGG